jgi:GAF domain
MGIVPSTNRHRVKEAVDRFVARVRHNIDVHLDTLAGDLVKAIEEDGGKVSAEGVSDLARAASAIQTQEGKLDMLAKLVGAMRLQDDATTLRGILEALARGGSTEAARVAVMLVDGSSLHSFADHGFLAGARPTDTPLESYSAIAAVVRDRQRLVLAAPPGARLPEVPPFMRAMSGNSALVVPVIVAGAVVAILFAEGPERVAGQTATSVWMEHIEVLVRHAASRLENITSRRTVEVLTSTG